MDEWNKMLSGDIKHHIKEGFLIIGPNLSDGTLCRWHCDSEHNAIIMATSFSERSGNCYEIVEYKFKGIIRPTVFPTKYVKPE